MKAILRALWERLRSHGTLRQPERAALLYQLADYDTAYKTVKEEK